jgi:hypothetical protein
MVADLNTVAFYCGILTLENVSIAVNYHGIFISLASGTNIIKFFNAVFYHHFMMILPFCVIKLYYFGNQCEMTANYHGRKLYNIGP